VKARRCFRCAPGRADLAAALAEDPPKASSTPSRRQTLLLLYDPDVLDPARLDFSRDRGGLAARVVRLQACYDGADLDDVPVSWT